MTRSTKPKKTTVARLLIAGALAVASISVSTAGSVGAAPLGAFDETFPAGQVCAFALRVQGTGGDQVVTPLPNHRGDQITLSAGTGANLVFTNTATGRQLALPSRFSSTTTITHRNRSKTVYLLGWNVLFLFPSDTPAGPSTTLHVGLLVYNDDGNANFVVDQRQTHSRTTDICAAVS